MEIDLPPAPSPQSGYHTVDCPPQGDTGYMSEHE